MTISIRLCMLFLSLLLLAPSLAFAAKIHKVKKKETLTALAKKYHTSVAALKAANNIVNNRIQPGDRLVIPPRVAGSAEKQERSASYRVKKGDTLQRVARVTGVPVKELKRLNGVGGKRLRPGQVLALKDVDRAGEPAEKVARKSPLFKTIDLYSEEEFERSLAELTSDDPTRPVDLAKSLESGERTSALKRSAYSFLGTRYRFGGTSRSGIDCSSFVQQVFRNLEVDLPRTAREQFYVGSAVLPSELRKGDLVFFNTYARYPSHVGIYLGDNKMIHASSRDRRVVISAMNTPYYQARFAGAKRIASINPDTFNFSDLLAGIEEEKEEDILLNDTLDLAGAK